MELDSAQLTELMHIRAALTVVAADDGVRYDRQTVGRAAHALARLDGFAPQSGLKPRTLPDVGELAARLESLWHVLCVQAKLVYDAGVRGTTGVFKTAWAVNLALADLTEVGL